MTRIRESQFIDDFSRGGDSIGINIHELTPETLEKLKKAGVTADQLAKIAGSDGRISGKSEFKQLFKVIDGFDKDRSNDSIETRDDKNAPTPSGELYDALKSEVDRNVSKARMQGIIHLGMRKESDKEVKALEKENAAHGGVFRIDAYKSDGVLSYNGAQHDLNTPKGLESFQKALTGPPDKMDAARAQKFVDFLKSKDIPSTSKDELAQLGLHLFNAGNGKLQANRLILSGHGLPGGQVVDENHEGFFLTDVKNLAKIFPEGSKKIEHVAVGACFCAGKASFDELRAGFPNLKSAFGYKEYSPKAGEGAEDHLTAWAKMTDGADPSGVEPKFEKTATWNSVDGYKGVPSKTLTETWQAADDKKSAFDAYQAGGSKKQVPQGKPDPALDEYYARLGDLINHEDFKTTYTPAEQKQTLERRDAVLKLRMLIQSEPRSAPQRTR